jgi:hypothetical protein
MSGKAARSRRRALRRTISPARFSFEPARLEPAAFDVDGIMATFKIGQEEAQAAVESARNSLCMLSDTYQVLVAKVRVEEWETDVVWLSIKRRDRQPFHDWRELQGIKNSILGPETEAVELYPAESRCVDTSNQYHLWALPPGLRFPFGYTARMVVTGASGGGKSVQRPIEEGSVAP